MKLTTPLLAQSQMKFGLFITEINKITPVPGQSQYTIQGYVPNDRTN